MWFGPRYYQCALGTLTYVDGTFDMIDACICVLSHERQPSGVDFAKPRGHSMVGYYLKLLKFDPIRTGLGLICLLPILSLSAIIISSVGLVIEEFIYISWYSDLTRLLGWPLKVMTFMKPGYTAGLSVLLAGLYAAIGIFLILQADKGYDLKHETTGAGGNAKAAVMHEVIPSMPGMPEPEPEPEAQEAPPVVDAPESDDLIKRLYQIQHDDD